MIIGIGYLSIKLNYKNTIIAKQKNNLQNSNNFKNELFSVLGHDLRAPMHQILTISNKLIEAFQKKENKKMFFFLKQNKSTATKTYLLLDNLLYWIRLQSNNMTIQKELHNIYELIQQTISIFNIIITDKSIQLKVECSDYIFVKTNAVILKILFRNLLDNALKFTPKSGSITVKCIENQFRIVIMIKDNGLGIDPELLKALNNYNTTDASIMDTSDKRSTGFGIRLCKSFIKKLGGGFKILSVKNKGTTSIISILK
ncbi:sensor histidine kinase [Flavivirga jejuensis]|uniref:histidine kinase n=1 Tax=Flavivirga jejuensis TaxID=870487 RepID=A0ABT8WP33_9FLAO|nr:HAMP domain-containing sensor histidine kinase [Flavivirga jejuensis]MDO5974908.1 HAMP domain-containing sensor histidine kinase [Flavivirga jejuensis]